MSAFRRAVRAEGDGSDRAPARGREERPRAERARARRVDRAHGAMRFLAAGPAGYPFLNR